MMGADYLTVDSVYDAFAGYLEALTHFPICLEASIALTGVED